MESYNMPKKTSYSKFVSKLKKNKQQKEKSMKVKRVDPALRPQTKIKAPKREIPYHN